MGDKKESVGVNGQMFVDSHMRSSSLYFRINPLFSQKMSPKPFSVKNTRWKFPFEMQNISRKQLLIFVRFKAYE